MSRLSRPILFVAVATLGALGIVPVANLLGGSAAVPWWSAAVRDWLASGSLIVLVALALGLVLAEHVDRSIAWTMALVLKPSPRAFQALVALLVLTLTATFAVYCFARARTTITPDGPS